MGPIEEIRKISQIAKICHEANRAYCETLGDYSQVPWDHSLNWQILSAIDGVQHKLNNPDATPEQMHRNWLQGKLDTGWKYGPVKDVDKKEHPCMVPYDELPEDQKIKDKLFSAIVSCFS
jgi:RyR domain